MNIKNQIQESVDNIDDFAFSASSVDQKENFKHLANVFLDSQTYGECERNGRILIDFILLQHDKSSTVGPILEFLNNFELYGKYDYKGKQRLHFSHQANVFLLGLFLYHKIPFIRKKICKEMELTTKDIEITIDGIKENIRYSGGDKYGEFLYRWRLAALSHDIGYSISLAGNDTKKIGGYLDNISAYLSNRAKKLEDILLFNGKDLLKLLDDYISEVSVIDYMKYQKAHPFNDEVYYDHGVISSLIFSRLMHEVYERHRDILFTRVNSTQIVWHKSFLNRSIKHAATAIALHNLDQYQKALQKTKKVNKIFDFNKNTFAWLLKVSDILQEWDKEIAKEENMIKKLDKIKMNITCKNDKIIVKDFPKVKINGIKETIDNFTTPNDLIDFN